MNNIPLIIAQSLGQEQADYNNSLEFHRMNAPSENELDPLIPRLPQLPVSLNGGPSK
jgi:hypothetical protein